MFEVTKFVLGLALLVIVSIAQADPGDDRILAAREAANKGDLSRLSMLAGSPTPHVLEPYVQYWLLAGRIARTSDPAPADAINEFLRRNAGSVLAERLRMAWIKRLASEKRWQEFDSEYVLLAQPDQETQCWAAQSGGQFAAENMKKLSEGWLTLTALPDACDVPLQMLFTNGTKTQNDVWLRFRQLVENKHLSKAGDFIQILPKNEAPDPATLKTALANPARFLGSDTARQANNRDDREVVMAALVRLARTKVEDAAKLWQRLQGKNYSREEQGYVWGQLAWMAAIRQMPEAGQWFEQATDTHLSDDQYAWKVRIALRSENWAKVRSTIESMPPALRAQPAWTYWLGRALAAQGDTSGSKRMFQQIAGEPRFYGILATEALGRQYAWPAAAQPVSPQEIANAQASPDLQRALALYRLNMRTEAMREWNWALRNADDRFLLAAAELARRNGLYDRAINTAERTQTQHDFSLRYLAPFYDVFAQQAKAQNLDLAWVYGLARQESRFQPVVRSGAGAQGLMQIMPATGRWIARKQGFKDYSADWLTRIDENIQVGCAYLRHVLDLLSNNPVMASAAYNAGPGRPRRWRDDSRPMEGAIFAETIPFNETREYVKRVMTNTEMYATLFDAKPVSLTTRLGSIPAKAREMALAPDEP